MKRARVVKSKTCLVQGRAATDAKAIWLFTIAVVTSIVAVGETANAGIVYAWTNGGVANDLDDPNNWNQPTAPASVSKIGTTDSTDIIRFDSETTTLPTANIDLVRISATNKLPYFELLNGSLNINRAENWGWGGVSFTIGDGDLATLAQANFAGIINLNRDGGSKTYVVNADGTVKMNSNIDFGQSNSVIRLLGGDVDAIGRIVNSNFTNIGSNFVSFEALGSTFTANYGGQLANATAVTDEFGDSFRLGGALASDPNASLTFTDNVSSFTVGVVVVPEPSAFALAGVGLLSLAALLRRSARAVPTRRLQRS